MNELINWLIKTSSSCDRDINLTTHSSYNKDDDLTLIYNVFYKLKALLKA